MTDTPVLITCVCICIYYTSIDNHNHHCQIHAVFHTLRHLSLQEFSRNTNFGQPLNVVSALKPCFHWLCRFHQHWDLITHNKQWTYNIQSELHFSRYQNHVLWNAVSVPQLCMCYVQGPQFSAEWGILAEPRNLPISAEFLCFHRILRNSVLDGDKMTNAAYFDGEFRPPYCMYTISPWNTWLPLGLYQQTINDNVPWTVITRMSCVIR